MTAHRTLRLVLSLLAGLLLAGTFTTAAHAEDGYRFWGYYQWDPADGAWAFAQKGPNEIVPEDGAVEGWRFAVGGTKPRTPRAAGDFEAICGSTPAESGKKRVALVIDPGTPEDAPSGDTPQPAGGTCVVADQAATGAKILAAAEPVRIEKGQTCGIDGYPAKGCGDPVKNIRVPATDAPVELQIAPAVGSSAAPAGPSQSTQDDGTPWTGIGVAAIAVLLLAGGGVLLARRRTSQPG